MFEGDLLLFLGSTPPPVNALSSLGRRSPPCVCLWCLGMARMRGADVNQRQDGSDVDVGEAVELCAVTVMRGARLLFGLDESQADHRIFRGRRQHSISPGKPEAEFMSAFSSYIVFLTSFGPVARGGSPPRSNCYIFSARAIREKHCCRQRPSNQSEASPSHTLRSRPYHSCMVHSQFPETRDPPALLGICPCSKNHLTSAPPVPSRHGRARSRPRPARCPTPPRS